MNTTDQIKPELSQNAVESPVGKFMHTEEFSKMIDTIASAELAYTKQILDYFVSLNPQNNTLPWIQRAFTELYKDNSKTSVMLHARSQWYQQNLLSVARELEEKEQKNKDKRPYQPEEHYNRKNLGKDSQKEGNKKKKKLEETEQEKSKSSQGKNSQKHEMFDDKTKQKKEKKKRKTNQDEKDEESEASDTKYKKGKKKKLKSLI